MNICLGLPAFVSSYFVRMDPGVVESRGRIRIRHFDVLGPVRSRPSVFSTRDLVCVSSFRALMIFLEVSLVCGI